MANDHAGRCSVIMLAAERKCFELHFGSAAALSRCYSERHCAYRERLIQRLLLKLRHKRPINVNLCMAFEMVAATWVATSPSLTENCFKHVGFATTVQPSPTVCASASPHEDLDEGALDGESSGSAVPLSLTNVWGVLRAINIDTPDELTVDAFVRPNDDIVVYEEVTDEAMIESVCEADDTEDQEDARGETQLSGCFGCAGHPSLLLWRT
ncbi:hypothetical protein HPB51_020404 [Rhipicephalus microplus]|uniref:Tick transposon n=1 Tax=Rhipicephalus microplus TaxID=6941 RepID=A0A9J6DWG1_RHIMP|nr:hypothetical protein HPB51_020404 [Rhipicephalus microplus]